MTSCFECNQIEDYKMNETVNKFLSTQDRFLAEMHSKQPELNYSAYGPFTKNK